MFISPWNTHLFLKEQDWNPVNHDNDQMNQVTQPTNDAQHVYVSGEKYSLKRKWFNKECTIKPN